MKRLAIIFVLAVIVPSFVLAYLAIRSARDQEYLLQRQQSLLYQGVADALAAQVQAQLTDAQQLFTSKVAARLQTQNAAQTAGSFDDWLRRDWALVQVGFVVTLNGDILAPSPLARPETKLFCADYSRFLANRESAEVYLNLKQGYNPSLAANSLQNTLAPDVSKNLTSKGPVQRAVVPQQQASAFSTGTDDDKQFSKVAASEAEFRQLIGDATEGTLARFVDNKLNVLFWCRPGAAPGFLFGAQLSLPMLVAQLRELLQGFSPELRNEICLAIVDDTAHPVARTHPDLKANWKRPFAATELGESLPHWEAAIYLLDPARLSRSAQSLRLTLALVIAVMVLAIALGSWLIVVDLKRQLRLARQKTDFVSNVSHELKTPLTSIRMFSELLAEGRVSAPEKQRTYLAIITAEAARLTRLINNVLDFSRLERGEKEYDFKKCDLSQVMRDTLNSYRPHLESNGFKLEETFPAGPVFVRADPDALAQIIVNLLSNAEKYSSEQKEILVEVRGEPGTHRVVINVSDRGLGIPDGCEEKIFEQFYRAHDSLSSGIQGSGLGLTLARQIARAHGGDLLYERRAGGGSCFVLTLPMVTDNETVS